MITAPFTDTPVTCPRCEGSGTDPDPQFPECIICVGHKVVHPDLAALVIRVREEKIRDREGRRDAPG
jgi:DnaJ-class molecular chaperone